MERKNFLKGLGLAGLGLALPSGRAIANGDRISQDPEACTLIPSETAGPFPLDLTENTQFFRQDIRETKTGALLRLKMKIIGLDNCEPMPNVRVNVWHCDKDGLYSGYSQNNNPGQAGLTYLRGYQITDADGIVNFTSIFPGWYTGRICHIHFQVYVSSAYSAVSQMTFDIAAKNALYSANSALYTKGADPMTYATDNIFSDGYTFQLATLTENPTLGGYDAYLEVVVKGAGTVGVGYQEKLNGTQFALNQNFPNPHSGLTTIPFTLHHSADVKLELFDLQGRTVHRIQLKGLEAGEHQVPISLKELQLPQAHYVYQIEVKNANGLFTQYKLMTAQM